MRAMAGLVWESLGRLGGTERLWVVWGSQWCSGSPWERVEGVPSGGDEQVLGWLLGAWEGALGGPQGLVGRAVEFFGGLGALGCP